MVSTPLWAVGQHDMGRSQLQRGLCRRACGGERGPESGRTEEQVKVASAFLGSLGPQGDRGGGQLQGEEQVEASSSGHRGMCGKHCAGPEFLCHAQGPAVDVGLVPGSVTLHRATQERAWETQSPEHGLLGLRIVFFKLINAI